MTLGQNDRWTGTASVGQIGAWEYTVEAWGDTFRSWQDEVRKKFNGGLRDLKSEALEGASLVSKAAARAGKSPDAKRLKAFASQLQQADAEALSTISASPELSALMTAWTDRSLSTTTTRSRSGSIASAPPMPRGMSSSRAAPRARPTAAPLSRLPAAY